jgi:signal transduction histidine kinase
MSRRPRDHPARLLPAAIAAVLLVLLAALATLQYRWIGRVSTLERQRLQASLREDGARFTEDFDRELTRAFLYFHPAPARTTEERLAGAARQLRRWRAEAPWPGLVRDLLAARRTADGSLELAVLRPGAQRFEPVPWTAVPATVRRRLTAAVEPGRPPFPWASSVDPDVPGLVLPLMFPPSPAPMSGGVGADDAVLVVRLDERVMAGEILPELTRRHFGSRRGTHYSLAVLDARGRAVFRSDPSVPLEAFRQADLRLDMLGLRPFHELRHLAIPKERGEPAPPAPDTGFRILAPGPHGPHRASSWHLVIDHRRGSLETAVSRVRWHNLTISLGVLLLVAATTGLMMVTTHRAQRLARQQIEFVAGVTHELHTPLTAIRSAGQNLADGVVADPQQVRRYGSLIEREGRRLTDMVGQALELAGIQSGRRIYHPRPEEVARLVDGALADCRGLLDERTVRVERDIPPDLPPVLADGPALRGALRNLIENAVRHGHAAGEESWVGLSARRGPDGIEITVSDRGPGIRREDLPHLFEPFYRGRDASANGVPGSGLGLSLVRHVAEALGGRVSVAADGSGPGSAFTLHLPAAAREETAV